ncbi:restriction endonuclease subunit S [Clostridium tyrobutyricum]|uniref:restriction endonuclease subunit S n=1 Tax=Clostridium tyrobutyricum TaxID=1519 RepID=UPI002B1F2EAA|nr:restriction endonuclease subunit S [Clostridium tyrobutyricum]MEA5008711.1 restriction endonuclease subunit S [Clostridium tyrobutyricum]
MEKNNDKPKLRFPGFNDSWEQRKLGELVTLVVREVPKPTEPYEKISVRSHAKGTFHQKIKNPDAVAMNKLFVVRENDLIVNITFAWEHAIAVATKEDDGLLVSHRFPTYTINNSDVGFIKYVVSQENFRRKMELISPGGAGRNRVLDKKSFLNIQVIAPIKIEEQHQIGVFFQRLDHLITLHQRKLNHLQDEKKGLLQKMFPKNGEDFPELRFPGFTDPWEQRKLGEMSDSFEYGLNAAAKEFDGENKYVRITDIDDESRRFLDSNLTSPNADLSNADNYKLKSGDILFARTGASVGKSYIYKEYDGLVYYAGFLIRARIKPEYNAEFVFQNTLTNRYNNYISIISQRSGQPGVNAQEYAEFNLKVPKYEEQLKIGVFFEQLDHLITLHQRKLNHLKEQKKALLQQMFI